MHSIISTTAYFEDIRYHIRQELLKATECVKICVAWINQEIYGTLLSHLSQKGIRVEVIYNHDSINHRYFNHNFSSINFFPIKARGRSLMHNKFCIIDNSTLLTGSYNWSKGAPWHFENLVVIKNDFKLIKDFIIEFEDLKNYYSNYAQQNKTRCLYEESSRCRSSSYNLGILGDESGKYDESLSGLWNICLRHEHATKINTGYEQFLLAQLGLKNDYYDDYFEEYDKHKMLSEVKEELDILINLHNYFSARSKNKIHALGSVVQLNQNEHIEWGEPEEYGINIFWRDMYYRKIIPSILYDDGYGFVNEIINEHRF